MNLASINPFNLSNIRTLFTPINFDFVPNNLIRAIGNLFKSIGNISETVSGAVFYPIHFTELQTILLTVFLVIFSINLALIGVYWQKYGGVITDRFIRPSTLKEIEELKLSVAKLKLPVEHTPRI